MTRTEPHRCTTGTPPGTPTTAAPSAVALRKAGVAVRRVDEQRKWQTVRDRRAQHAYERTMNEPVMMREKDLAAIAQELKSQGLQPGADADRALASIANGALAHMGITPERTHERDYDRTDDFGPSR